MSALVTIQSHKKVSNPKLVSHLLPALPMSQTKFLALS